MSAPESVFDRAHRLEHEARAAARPAPPGDLPQALARLEAQLTALLAEVRALRAALPPP
jgi:hypothetical protein